MRIVIDMQGAQSESRFRGIGRYTLSLAKALVINRGKHEVILALSGLFPQSIEPIRAAFAEHLSPENIRVWYAPGPVCECEPENVNRRKVAELIREAFLVSLKPDIIHIASLFEGYFDNAVTSIGCFNSSIPVSVSLYDLIPLINDDQYLSPDLCYAQHYQRKIEYLNRASLLLSISESSRNEGLRYLARTEKEITNISTAADDQFQPLSLTKKQKDQLLKRFDINRPFIFFTGGSDKRKNISRLLSAYSQLSPELRKEHQLVLSGKINRTQLHSEAANVGLKEHEYCITDHVTDDELVQLYNQCKLFVFPSWHEGFGLPALEAMACGAPVIAANTTSLPEIVDREDALFDPYSIPSIIEKITQLLEDKSLRTELSEYGLKQARKFSWDGCAKKAISAFQQHISAAETDTSESLSNTHKLRLAFISPLPPQRSGIANYSAELLPALKQHYEIDVIVAQEEISDPFIQANFPIRTIEWFENNVKQYDRILYQLGNSPFHRHMFNLLQRFPGTVVLHDFYLSSVKSYLEINEITPHLWIQSLYASHGYSAVKKRCEADIPDEVIDQYPCNFEVLQHANGIIVHSHHAKQLAKHWYGQSIAAGWHTIPLLRTPPIEIDKQTARHNLELKNDDFIVCSFGLLAPTKLNHRLLQAWVNSALAKDPRCKLIFVGENHHGQYGQQLLEEIEHNNLSNNVRITGWVDSQTYQNYLVAADVGVQLRTSSRGETSATVLDSMNHALATIVNANGSMAELPPEAVWMLPDKFENYQLIQALEFLRENSKQREKTAHRAQEIIHADHAPDACARQYAAVIEHNYAAESHYDCNSLIKAIADLSQYQPDDSECAVLAQSIVRTLPLKECNRQLLIDVSATRHNDLKTGIQRVVRALVWELIHTPPTGYRVEPIYLSHKGGAVHYRYAQKWVSGLLDCTDEWASDPPVTYSSGDIFFAADFIGVYPEETENNDIFQYLRGLGVQLHFIVYDLLPLQLPHFFPPNSFGFSQWLNTVNRVADNMICISNSVASDLQKWQQEFEPKRIRPAKISWFHLGADVDNSIPTTGLPDSAEEILEKIRAVPSFLMVGTIEPRKGYLQTLKAFSQMWSEGYDINLVIVGTEGWRDLPDDMRCTIPEIVGELRSHPQRNKQLFWLEGISDEYLDKVYAASTCLIAASEGEGFGLPLIEAGQHQLPIIARDIAVFNEVAGQHAYYFNGSKPSTLVRAIVDWLTLYRKNLHPKSDLMPWLTWKESVQQLLGKIMGDKK